MPNKIIRVGSRESVLAVAQTELVMETIRKNHPEVELELVTMKTTGDKILDKSLDKIGGKGLFVKELDKALMEGRIDISVHSLKDMPMETPDELPILAYSKRGNPFDCLVLPEGVDSSGRMFRTSQKSTASKAVWGCSDQGHPRQHPHPFKQAGLR